MEQIKKGDIIERCTLMPAIVQEVKGNNITSYDFGYVSETYNGGSCCSNISCSVRKITPEFALMLLFAYQSYNAEHS